jgi:DNA-3-methyladenine glycosylase I
MAARKGLIVGDDGVTRCWWPGDDPLYRTYHDEEWALPHANDVRTFEKMCLEGFQAGLSWLTVLRKRENFRRAFKGFDPAAVARFNERSVKRLLGDAGIIRHRGKIESTINNARRTLELIEERGSLAAYFWDFEPPPRERPRRLTHTALLKMAETPSSRALSKDLKRRGFTFVGPTTMYAHMQAMGLVNDHLEGCAFRARTDDARSAFARP